MRLTRLYEGTKLGNGNYAYNVDLTGGYIYDDKEGFNIQDEQKMDAEVVNNDLDDNEHIGTQLAKYTRLDYVKSLKFDEVLNGFVGYTTRMYLETDHELTPDEESKVKDEVEGQAADGWGENGFVLNRENEDDNYDDYDDTEYYDIEDELVYYPWSEKTKVSIVK